MSYARLQKKKQDLLSSGEQDYSFKQHFNELFHQLQTNHQKDGLRHFEQISLATKKSHIAIKDPLDSKVLSSAVPKPQDDQWYTKNKKLSQKPKCKVEGEDGRTKLVQTDQLGKVADVVRVSQMLEWACCSIGTEFQVYQLQMSLKHLAARTGALQLRFWGKIFGTQRDYIIAEGFIKQVANKQNNPGVEKRGQTGCNRNTYWVTDNILEDWVELPDVTPQQIISSRFIKHIFTGDLNSSVKTYPPFPGKQRHLLRAQIARIGHSTWIAPKDVWQEKEEQGDQPPQIKQLEVKEDAKVPAVIMAPSSTLYFKCKKQQANITQAGRLQHQQPKMPQGLDEQAQANWSAEDELAKLNEADPQVQTLRMSTLDKDKEAFGFEHGWQIQAVGDNQTYNLVAPREGTESYSTIVLRSMSWPGSVTVAQFGAYASVYVGYGIKAGGCPFHPIEPPEVQSDPIDAKEQPEPYPLVEPEETIETDTDKVPEDQDDDS